NSIHEDYHTYSYFAILLFASGEVYYALDTISIELYSWLGMDSVVPIFLAGSKAAFGLEF
ncbi:24325_t:CDS:2, partial [Racocetra persica]